MSDFDDELVATAADFLAAFGEDVTYYPLVGDARAIKMVVIRNGISPVTGMPVGSGPDTQGIVANSAVTGISSDEVDRGGDEVDLEVNLGETAQRRPITSIVDQDVGMVTYGLR